MTLLRPSSLLVTLMTLTFLGLLALDNLRSIQAQAADGPTIDILIGYTLEAKRELGGSARIEQLIRLAVTETNVIYANSGVHARLRLVGTVEANYDQASVNNLLRAIRIPDDGVLDDLHELRNRTGADLVSLVTSDSEGGSFGCGVAYQTRARPADEAQAFSLVRVSCLVNYWTLAHEIGHNMGLCHEGATPDCGFAPYAQGYANPEGRFYTMMSYGCPDPIRCQKIPHFSNPAITFRGQPTGVAGKADEARSLNEVSKIVAAWRPTATTLSYQVHLPLVQMPRQEMELLSSLSDEMGDTAALAVLNPRQIVTAVRGLTGEASITLWSVTPEGQLTMDNRWHGETVSAISIARLSSERFVVAEAIVSNQRHRVTVWDLHADGTMVQMGQPAETPVIEPTLVSVAGLSPSRFVTAVRRGDSGRQLVTVWNITSDGKIERRGNYSAELSGTVSIAATSSQRLVTAVRDDELGGSLSVRFWEVNAEHQLVHKPKINHSSFDDAVVAGLSEHRFISAARDGNDSLKLIVFDDVGARIPYQQGIAYTRAAGPSALATHGAGRVAVAARHAEGGLELTLWDIAASGDMAQRSETLAPSLAVEHAVAVSWLDSSRLIIVTLGADQRLMLTIWQSPYAPAQPHGFIAEED